FEPRRHGFEHQRVTFFVYVVENKIEFTSNLGQTRKRVPDMDLDHRRNAGAVEVALRLTGVVGTAVGVVHFRVFSSGTSQPDGGIAEGRTQFEDALCAGRHY